MVLKPVLAQCWHPEPLGQILVLHSSQVSSEYKTQIARLSQLLGRGILTTDIKLAAILSSSTLCSDRLHPDVKTCLQQRPKIIHVRAAKVTQVKAIHNVSYKYIWITSRGYNAAFQCSCEGHVNLLHLGNKNTSEFNIKNMSCGGLTSRGHWSPHDPSSATQGRSLLTSWDFQRDQTPSPPSSLHRGLFGSPVPQYSQ